MKTAAAMVSTFGEKTKAYVVMELTHDGNSQMAIGGSLIDVSWLKTTLEHQVFRVTEAHRANQTANDTPSKAP